MHPFERISIRIRHAKALRRAEPLWALVRPAYNRLIELFGSRGLRRNINGTDAILVLPTLRGVTETYEPAIWSRIMQVVKPGDTIVDVGAHYGLYAVAFAKRVGLAGRVHAFEPEPSNCAVLRRQIDLNSVGGSAQVHEVAVGKDDALIAFASQGEESHLSDSNDAAARVRCVMLDTYLPDQPVSVLKIDVEGYEEWVLMGAERLLRDPIRRPRAVFIEVHPYAWPQIGTTSAGLLGRLRSAGYHPRSMDDEELAEIQRYGHIYATCG